MSHTVAMFCGSTQVRRQTPAHTPRKFSISSTRLARAIWVSKYASCTRPPLAVTLKLPSLGLISATSVGRKMYQASTAS
ncbi:hypothetical protein D9M72_526570 [compost metagenome]